MIDKAKLPKIAFAVAAATSLVPLGGCASGLTVDGGVSNVGGVVRGAISQVESRVAQAKQDPSIRVQGYSPLGDGSATIRRNRNESLDSDNVSQATVIFEHVPNKPTVSEEQLNDQVCQDRGFSDSVWNRGRVYCVKYENF